MNCLLLLWNEILFVFLNKVISLHSYSKQLCFRELINKELTAN